MTITYHAEFEQGSLDWIQRRCGMLTASEIKHIMTLTLKPASNDKERQHLYELLAQRVNNFVEPHYISDAMLRGDYEEIAARDLYSEKYEPVSQCAFVTNNAYGFHLGYSPDGLVGDDGLIEVKSRRQSYQAQTIIEGVVPAEYVLQIQTGLLVTERKWCDFLSYSGGMPMFVLRVFPDAAVQDAIVAVATLFEARMREKLFRYAASAASFPSTERRDYEEIRI